MTAAPLTDAPSLRPTACAICGLFDHSEEVYEANFDAEAFSTRVFSARRLPDRIHYRLVRCRTCGLLRSDPVLTEEALERLYRSSTFDYGDELPALKATYGRAIATAERRLGRTGALLDVGCGNGFVLEQALAQRWTDVCGVEPSRDAIAQAAPVVRDRIVEDMMRPGLFEPGSFDLVTLFQVLDHLPDPLEVLAECRRILAPGGVVLAFNHNAAAVSARLLGERSPIVDIEHTYLYTPATMRALFVRAGFTDVEVGPVRNTYSLAYLTHLLPLPERVKDALLPLARRRLGGVRLTVPLGNLCLMARS